jgi:hypothetical protein
MTVNINATDLANKAKLLGLGITLTYDQKINLYRGMVEEATLNLPAPSDPNLPAVAKSLTKALDAYSATVLPTP